MKTGTRGRAGGPADDLGAGALLLTLMVVVVAVCLATAVSAAAADGASVEPERIDVVHNRVARQLQTTEVVLEILERLESVENPGAAEVLLAAEGEAVDLLRQVLSEVARNRSRPVEMPTAPVVAGTPPDAREALRPEVVYAQAEPARAVVAVRGTHYVAVPGGRIEDGDDVVEVVAVRAAGSGLEVELRVNGGSPVTRRPKR